MSELFDYRAAISLGSARLYEPAGLACYVDTDRMHDDDTEVEIRLVAEFEARIAPYDAQVRERLRVYGVEAAYLRDPDLLDITALNFSAGISLAATAHDIVSAMAAVADGGGKEPDTAFWRVSRDCSQT